MNNKELKNTARETSWPGLKFEVDKETQNF